MSTRRIEESKRKQQEELNCNTKKMKLSIAETKQEQITNNETQFMEDNLDKNVGESGSEIITINHQLDHDCLVKIFSYLSALDRLEIRKVCKKWEEAVAMSWSNVKKIDTENLEILLHKKESTLKELLNNCCKYLTHLTIVYQCSWMTDVLKNNCENIVFFDINLCSEYSHNLCEIIESMTKLKILKATTIRKRYEFPDLWNELIEILPADIEEIHLSKFKRDFFSLNDRERTLELNKFKNIRCLTLKYFPLTTATIESILLNKNSLIYLDLYGCLFPEDCPIIFTKLVNLEHLNLRGDENLGENIITEITHNCHKLKYLSINWFNIQGSILSEFKYLNNLEHLDFPRVVQSDDNFISNGVDNCKKLKYLNVGEGGNFSTLDIKAITKLNNLQYVDLRNAKIDSELFINIANNCPELKEIKIIFERLPEIALEKLTNLKKLEKLNLARCENLTGNLLSKIVNNCKNLVDLDFSYCVNVTEDSLIQVGKLNNLKKLNISGIENVPNSMFFNYRKLEELSCAYCPSVTDEAIKKVIDNCRGLYYLNVFFSEITVDTLVHAAKRKFSFKILNIIVDEYLNIFNSYNKSSPYLNITVPEKP